MHGGQHLSDMPNVIDWDVNAYCDAPLYREISGVDYPKQMQAYKWRYAGKHLTVRMSGLPCRKCVKCLRVRARRWRDRAETELASCAKTWMVTLTYDAMNYHRLLMESMLAKNRKGYPDTDFSTPEGEFQLMAWWGGMDVTKYLKRVRKQLPPRSLRYLLVTETGELRGRMHFHLLLHGSADLTYRVITSPWNHGFIHAKLADAKAPRYVTKYVAKSMLSRVRASVNYGSISSDEWEDIAEVGEA